MSVRERYRETERDKKKERERERERANRDKICVCVCVCGKEFLEGLLLLLLLKRLRGVALNWAGRGVAANCCGLQCIVKYIVVKGKMGQ